MRFLIPLLILVASCSLKASEEGTRTSIELPPTAEVAPLVSANNRFAFELWAKAAAHGGNLALSPASITTALAMTWGGANAATADEMRRVLHLEGDPVAVMAQWGKLAGALQSPGHKRTLRIANRLFGERTYKFEQPYLDHTSAAYGAPLEPVDFKNDADAVRRRINGWVEDQTEKRIKGLLPAGAITEDTRLALVNAIYFLADWDQPFLKQATYPQQFAITATTKQSIPMMHVHGTFRRAKADGVKVVEVPYKGGGAAMWLVVPDAVDGLREVESSLDAGKVDGWKAAFQPAEVNLALPRFKIDPKAPLELSNTLQALGMVQAFDRTSADFTGIAVPPDPEHRLYISAITHKAFVKVDEQGTEAAAATGVVLAEPTSVRVVEAVTVDRPFLFLIVDNTSGLILFVGRVADPSAE